MTTATTDTPTTTEQSTHAAHFPDLSRVDIQHIDCDRNHRVPRPGDDKRIAALMASIERSGQLQAVRVYKIDGPVHAAKPRYVLGFGWRRCEAMKRLGFDMVRAEIYPPAPDHEIEAARAVENPHRQDITPIEEAQAVADILAAYQEERPTASRLEAMEHAAAETARSVSWIRDRDYFARLTPAVRELAVRVPIPAGHLRELAKVGDQNLQLDTALNAVYAPQYGHKAGTLTPRNAVDKKVWAAWLARVESGVVHIARLDKVKDEVAAAQRNLGRVPWSLTLPVLVKGRGALPACDECRHNTANDHTLFGLEGEQPECGTCMNPDCYEAKTDASTKAREAAARPLLKIKGGPTPAKINAKVASAPGWLDTHRLKGFLQRQVKKAGEPAKAGGEHADASATRTPTKRVRVPQDINSALDDYTTAMRCFYKTEIELILDEATRDTPRRAGLILFQATAIAQSLCQSGVDIPTSWEREKGKLEPTPAEPLGEDTIGVVGCIASGDPNLIVEIVNAEPCQWEPLDLVCLPEHEELLALLMPAMRVPKKKIVAAPKWEAFAVPLSELKPTRKKKRVAKRVTKKKTPRRKNGGAN